MSENLEKKPVVIAGAGPVGLYTAVLLVRAGMRVIVLEKFEGLALDMRASTFHPATLDLLDQVELADALIARGSIASGWQCMFHGTKNHAVFDLESISDLTGHPYRLQCDQYHFGNLAISTLLGNPLFEIRFGHELLDVSDSGGEVRLKVRNGGEYELTTPWLIAADGGNSTVRSKLGLVFEGSVLPSTTITLVVKHPFEEEIPGLLGVNYVWTETGFYSLMQILDLWRFSYSPDSDQSVAEATSPEVAQSHLQSVFPSPRPYEIIRIDHYTLQQRCLKTFRAGRVLFVGDSAHLNSPTGGMGMNSGMHDAHCLVEHLVPVLEGENDALLDRYSRRRRTIALEEIQRLSGRNFSWHRETDPAKRAKIWRELQNIVNDPQKTREFLLESSLIRSRWREQEID